MNTVPAQKNTKEYGIYVKPPVNINLKSRKDTHKMKTYYLPEIFNHTLDGIDRDNHIVATYYMKDVLEGEDFLDHFALIQALALEGSTGTWETVEEDTEDMRKKLSGKLVGYFEIPATEKYTRLDGQLSDDASLHLRQLFCLLTKHASCRCVYTKKPSEKI